MLTGSLPLSDPLLLKDACLISGEWRQAGSGETLEVRNPSSGELLGRVPALGLAELEEAAACASEAQQAWARRLAKDRSAILRRWFELIVQHANDLATLITAESGKPLAEALSEANYAAAFVEWFAEEAKRAYGTMIPSPFPEKRILVMKQPVGVVAAITPWNFPAAMLTRKAAAALAAGCAVIAKPAEQTPLTALALAELGCRAGLPPGVLQILTGEPQRIGSFLCADPRIAKISFTGSTEVGRELMRQCAPRLKRLSLELGGNAPFLVFEDADLDAAVDGALASKFRNAGQTCVCANRFYVEQSVYEDFARKLAERARALVVGPGREPGVQVGPLINAEALAKVERHVTDAVAKGARVLAGGRRHPLGGTFFEPTVLINCTQDMAVVQEETFGPLAPLIPFRDEHEALTLANATDYGLAAFFYTRDSARMWRVAEALEAGMVGHNTGLLSTEVAPFGGIKQSGFGREGSYRGLDEYLELKYFCASAI